MPPPRSAVHWVRAGYSNVYLVEDGRSLFLADCGAASKTGRVLEALRALGRSPGDVDLIVATHRDVDHIGGAGVLKTETGAPLAMHAGAFHPYRVLLREPRRLWVRSATSFRFFFARTQIRRFVREMRRARRTGRSEAGEPSDAFVHPPRPDLKLHDGDPLPGHPSWTVLHVPGHSSDSICLYEARSGSLIAGDLLVTHRGRLTPTLIYEDRSERDASIRRLGALPIRAVYPGHGRIIRGASPLADLADRGSKKPRAPKPLRDAPRVNA